MQLSWQEAPSFEDAICFSSRVPAGVLTNSSQRSLTLRAACAASWHENKPPRSGHVPRSSDALRTSSEEVFSWILSQTRSSMLQRSKLQPAGGPPLSPQRCSLDHPAARGCFLVWRGATDMWPSPHVNGIATNADTTFQTAHKRLE